MTLERVVASAKIAGTIGRMTNRSLVQLLAGVSGTGLLAVMCGCATLPEPAETRSAPSATEAKTVRSPLAEPPGTRLGDVTQATIGRTICVPGWTATVRPSVSFTQGVKLKLLNDAGLDRTRALDYELDHFVPLALGGHPRSLHNLWLQRWDGEWSAKLKDRLERKLHVMVCAGQLKLLTARTAIERNWKLAYRKYVVPTLSREIELDGEEPVDQMPEAGAAFAAGIESLSNFARRAERCRSRT